MRRSANRAVDVTSKPRRGLNYSDAARIVVERARTARADADAAAIRSDMIRRGPPTLARTGNYLASKHFTLYEVEQGFYKPDGEPLNVVVYSGERRESPGRRSPRSRSADTLGRI